MRTPGTIQSSLLDTTGLLAEGPVGTCAHRGYPNEEKGFRDFMRDLTVLGWGQQGDRKDFLATRKVADTMGRCHRYHRRRRSSIRHHQRRRLHRQSRTSCAMRLGPFQGDSRRTSASARYHEHKLYAAG
jgi:hypothetical protein